jgi:prevent-host-death family protein
MKTASIRDLHIRTSELVREAADGTVITIERRGEPVAELQPFRKSASDPVCRTCAISGGAFRPPLAIVGASLKKIAEMYLDSAYVAKYYVNEGDAAVVRRLIRGASHIVFSNC